MANQTIQQFSPSRFQRWTWCWKLSTTFDIPGIDAVKSQTPLSADPESLRTNRFSKPLSRENIKRSHLSEKQRQDNRWWKAMTDGKNRMGGKAENITHVFNPKTNTGFNVSSVEWTRFINPNFHWKCYTFDQRENTHTKNWIKTSKNKAKHFWFFSIRSNERAGQTCLDSLLKRHETWLTYCTHSFLITGREKHPIFAERSRTSKCPNRHVLVIPNNFTTKQKQKISNAIKSVKDKGDSEQISEVSRKRG